MDLKKLQKKFNVTAEEVNKEMHVQADKVVDMLNKEITEPEAAERINNLKDIMLSRLQSWGIVNKHNKFEYLAITYKSIVDQYWREKDLPNEERAIFMIGCTDNELKAAQQKQLDEYRDGEKFYKRRTKEYKKKIKEWWKQRVNEEAAYRPKANGKYHGK